MVFVMVGVKRSIEEMVSDIVWVLERKQLARIAACALNKTVLTMSF